MSLWVDKYAPTCISQLDYHNSITSHLVALGHSKDIPHILVTGPNGAGKKTRVIALLKEIYGAPIEKLKMSQKSFQTPSGKKIEMNLVSSNYHIEMNPCDVGIYDRIVIQDILKEIAQSPQLDSSSEMSFKVVVINEADSMTKDAQHALRRTMEKYMNNLRIILMTTNSGKIINPVKSRCLLLRIPSPSTIDIIKIIESVSVKEGIHLPKSVSMKIATECNGNVRRALLSLEATKMKNYPFLENQGIETSDWESFLHHLVDLILQEQTPARLLIVRSKLYELLTHCIPPTIIIKESIQSLIFRCWPCDYLTP